MRRSKTALLAGAAAALLAGGFALASANLHTMTVQVPGGGVATIQYAGAVKPKVTFDNNPFAANFMGWNAPFAALQRASIRMDREMDAMMHDFGAWNANPLFSAKLENAPAGIHEYSMVSTLSGNHVCTRTMQITSMGNGKPKVVSHSSGDCGAMAGAGLITVHPLSPGTQSATLQSQAQNAPTLATVSYR